MKSNTHRFAILIALTVAHSICCAQVRPVTLQIDVQPRSAIVDNDWSSGELESAPFYGLVESVNGESALGSLFGKVTHEESILGVNYYRQVWTFTLQEADGTPAGVIVASGSSSHDGTELNRELQIEAGTGAYFGITGTIAVSSRRGSDSRQFREASYELSFIASIIPLCLPSIVTTTNGPAIVHARDFTLVSSKFPASPGEFLTLTANDLLPELKQSLEWPSEAHALTNIPVEVKVGGLNATILYVGQYPDVKSTYQINFQVPMSVPKSAAGVQIRTGFIGSAPITIPIG